MLDVNFFTTFIGWCTVINISILCFSTLLLFIFKGSISKIHSEMSGIKQNDLFPIYFKYLGSYKIAIIIFNLVPYFALRIMI